MTTGLSYAGIQAATHDAISGRRVRYRLYPATTGVPAVGISVVSGAGAWGNVADIVVAGALAADFWVCGFQLNSLAGGAVQIMEILISSTGPAAGNPGPVTVPFLLEARFDLTLVTPEFTPIMLPYPVFKVGGSRVAYCAGGAAARSLAVTMIYALGL